MGNFLSEAAAGAGYSLALLLRSVLWFRSAWQGRALKEILQQMFICGIASIPVCMVVSVFTGAILALNGGLSLADIGQESLIGRIVTISMTREMGPFMTALILAASVGSGMAAEIGTMSVSEEIDALEVMGIDPAKFLVMPRLVAMTIMCPVLTIYSNLLGIVGGAITSYYQHGVSLELFRTDAMDHLVNKDIFTGLLKAVIFGIVIASVGCSQGLRATGGAIGVGHATRRSVVISYLLIIILGYYITFIFYRLF
ncbi:MAG: ABC transporter permease [Planctomycetes bacterium]|nr:ABC transporter permease [Planctomycetota bacterium]